VKDVRFVLSFVNKRPSRSKNYKIREGTGRCHLSSYHFWAYPTNHSSQLWMAITGIVLQGCGDDLLEDEHTKKAYFGM
jgi:hypothetical protein